MKHLITVLLTLLCITITASAGSKEKFDELTAEINLIDAQLDELEETSGVIIKPDADHPRPVNGVMTREKGAKIYALYVAGLTLIDAILADKDLNEEHQAKLVGQMLDKLANSFFIFMRHNEDHRNPDGRVPFMTLIGNVMREIWHDVSILFTIRRDRESNTPQWGPLEENRREVVMQKVIGLMREKYGEQVPAVNESSAELRLRYFGQLHYIVDRAVNIRMERDRAQFFARGFYFFGGLFTLLLPPFDYAFDRTFYSTFNSGVVNASVFWFFYTMKGMTSSLETGKMWINFLNDLMKDKEIELTEKIRDMLKNAPKLRGFYFEPHIPFTLRMEFALREKIKHYWGKTRSMMSKKSCETMVMDNNQGR